MAINGNAESGVSIRPTEAVQMGLIDNFDGEVTDMKFRHFDYNGKSKKVLSIAVEILPDDGEKFIQDYSCGEAAVKNFIILPGNTKVKAVNPSVTGLPEGSNGVKFLSSVVSAKGGPVQFTEDMMTDDISALIGLRAHFLRVANAAPAGVVKKDTDKDGSILLVSSVLGLPGSKPAAGAKTPGAPRGRKSGASAGQPATVAPTNGQAQNAVPTTTAVGTTATPATDLTTKAEGVILGFLSSRGGSMTKQEVAQSVFADYINDPDRNKLISLVSKDDFLKDANHPWSFDGATLTL